jgi:hypothetical protein
MYFTFIDLKNTPKYPQAIFPIKENVSGVKFFEAFKLKSSFSYFPPLFSSG